MSWVSSAWRWWFREQEEMIGVVHLLLPSVSTSSNCYSLRPRTHTHNRENSLMSVSSGRLQFYYTHVVLPVLLDHTVVTCICLRTACKSLVVVKGVHRVARPAQLEYGSFPHLSPLLGLWSEIGSTLLAGFKHWIGLPSHLASHRGISDVWWMYPTKKGAWITLSVRKIRST